MLKNVGRLLGSAIFHKVVQSFCLTYPVMFPHISSKKVKSEVMVDTGDAPNGFPMFLFDAKLLASVLTESEILYLVVTDNSNTVAYEFIMAVIEEGIKISKEVKKGALASPRRESDKLIEGTVEK